MEGGRGRGWRGREEGVGWGERERVGERELLLHCCLQTSLGHCSRHMSLGSVLGNCQDQPSHSAINQ